MNTRPNDPAPTPELITEDSTLHALLHGITSQSGPDYFRVVTKPYFYFEAFDENWKGWNDPSEVEKHWGVFNADRSPKLVFKNPEAPTNQSEK